MHCIIDFSKSGKFGNIEKVCAFSHLTPQHFANISAEMDLDVIPSVGDEVRYAFGYDESKGETFEVRGIVEKRTLYTSKSMRVTEKPYYLVQVKDVSIEII